VKRGDPLLDPLLAPQTLTLSLPALSVDEAEMILQLIDQLHNLLWDAYGEAVADEMAEDQIPDTSGHADGDDDPDF
jgi:hypothetical protein